MNLIYLAVVGLLFAGQAGTGPWFMERAARAEELAKDGNQQEAMDILKEMDSQAAKLGPAESKQLWESFVAWKKGVCYFWLGDYGQSIATLKDIETNNVNRPFRHYLCRDLGEAYLDAGQTKK